VLLFIILNFAFLTQVICSATLSRLYRVLGELHMSTDTLVQNLHQFSAFYLGTKLALEITFSEWLSATQSLRLQLEFERFQYISLNYSKFSLLRLK